MFVLVVDHALHLDAGVHPERGGGLRGGRLVRAQRSCVAPAAVVRLAAFVSTCFLNAFDPHILERGGVCYSSRRP